MMNSDETTKSRLGRSFAQEMQQAIVDWVNKLPFIKRDVANNPEAEGVGKESAGQAPDLRPTDSPAAGESPESEGRNR
jgi:hypothetical protein